MGSWLCNDFSAGMNEVADPALLDNKIASKLVNAKIETGKAVSLKLPRKLANYTAESLGHYGRKNRSLVKFYERNYWSIDDAADAPFYGGDVENYLGIPYVDYSKNVKIEKVSSGNLTGKFKYCVTLVNPNGWESAPGAITDYEREVELTSQNTKITVSWSDSKISYAKIYRTTDMGADFYCVGEIKSSGGNLTDSTSDYTLVGLEPLSAIDNYPPPEGGKYLCESGGVFFLAVGSTLWFSALGNPHAWPLLNFVGLDDVITGIVPEFQGVLVFTKNNAYRITGADSLDTLTRALLPGNQGCKSKTSIAQVSNAPVWMSNDGICLWDGESVTIISQQVIDTNKLPVVCAVSANDCYYLFLKQGAIVFDHRHGDIFWKLDFTCDYAWYDAATDDMYLQRGDEVYLFDSGEDATYEYKSGYIGIPEAEYAFYKEVVLTIDGIADLTFYNENNAVFTVTIEKSGRHRIPLPYNTLGRYAQLSVSGVGTLREIALLYN